MPIQPHFHTPRTGRPASASVPATYFMFFPTGRKCQPEGEDIGSGCCGGGVIQLRLRERALLPGPISSSSGVRQSPYPARCILRIRHTSLTTVSTLAPITTTIIRITQYNKAPFFDGSPNTHNTILLITESPITSKA